MKNSLAIAAISEFTHEIAQSPEEAIATYGVSVNWESGTRTRVKTLPMTLGEHRINRDFEWLIDEPRQLVGTNQAPNPQEQLLGALGACVTVAFTVGATLLKVQLESLKVNVTSELDLAGFLSVDSQSAVGALAINVDIEVAGDGTQEQFEFLRAQAISHSPNAMTLMQGAEIKSSLTLNN